MHYLFFVNILGEVLIGSKIVVVGDKSKEEIPMAKDNTPKAGRGKIIINIQKKKIKD
ncbi:hypothetical protein KPL40_02995 [Clostridium gasigenes]|uniref:hypothetical protein n=1 Tax=Clostridium gasigenes TaxID=94869 RepID=UPI001C0D70C7|nr:hypothetical protein [Clostridium gasigenes]MBU3131408.1 hypothetical protein [Clostridium gasigenes]